MRGIFLMDDLFYKRIENFWDVTKVAWGKQEFLVRVMGDCKVLEAVVKIDYTYGNAAKVMVITEKDIERFTHGDIDSIFEDVTRLIHHYGGPNYKKVVCQAKFAGKALDYGWYVDQVVKGGDIR